MSAGSDPSDHVRIRSVETLSNNWYTLRKYTVDYRRRDGSWQQLSREACHRGDSAVVLLYSRQRGTVILTRQFRLPVYVNGNTGGMLLEVPGGLLDTESPAVAIRREAEEETGFRLSHVEEVLAAYMSPNLVTERIHFFVAEFDADDRVSAGGGSVAEGEDIEVVELPLDEALAMIERGEIADGKTVILLYHAKLKGLLGDQPRAGGPPV
jgi:GDP-mannose pyrophosphatase NudK